jgi:protein SCO1/2
MDDVKPATDTPWLEPRRVGLLALVVAVLMALLGFVILPALSNDEPETTPLRPVSQVIDPLKPLTNFTLTSADGQPLQLSHLQGKPVLLFFGFTNCPDICPTTLAEFRVVKQQLGDLGDDVAYVFVSVDGSRDTPEVVKEYVAQFDPAFIGLTGDEQAVRAIGAEFNLFFEQVDVGSAAGYFVNHSAYKYLIDADGRLRVIYAYETRPDLITEDLRRLLAEG